MGWIRGLPENEGGGVGLAPVEGGMGVRKTVRSPGEAATAPGDQDSGRAGRGKEQGFGLLAADGP